jgi:hypothetical protein
MAGSTRRVGYGARQGPQPANGGVKFTPTPDQQHAVACMASVGTPHEVIARAFAISENTLRRHFARELAHGREDIHAAIGKNITALALGGDKAAMFFFAKCQMGWRERSVGVGVEGRTNGEAPGNVFTISITG